MASNSRKVYTHGFFLNEQELRRIHDLIISQMARMLKDAACLTEFELRYRNGVVSKHANFESIFTEENLGSSSIQSLSISSKDTKDDPSTEVVIEYLDPKELYEDHSIRYEVLGEDRDWVFITSSQLEERIKRTKQLTIRKFVKWDMNGVMNYVALSLLFCAFLFTPIFYIGIRLYPKPLWPGYAILDKMELDWKAGKIKDPTEAVILIEKMRYAPYDAVPYQRTRFYFISGLLIVAVPIIFPLTWYFWPPYVFYWGEKIKVIDKKHNIGKFIVLSVFATIILSIVSNFLYDIIKKS